MNKDCARLITLLKDNHYEIAMESNGQFPVPSGIDHLTISPKRWMTKSGKPGVHAPFWFDPSNCPSEIKVVFDSDLEESVLDGIYDRYTKGEFTFKDSEFFFVSPEWSAFESISPRVIRYVQHNPQWRVSIQSHKLLGVK